MIRIGSTSHKVTSEQYSKSKQKDLFELEKQLEKSRLAVENMSFSKKQANLEKEIQHIQTSLQQSINQINHESKKQKILAELISLLKGEMSKVQSKQKRLEELENGEFQKKRKKLQYDIDKISQKQNEEIAKITVLKEKANSCRCERVVFSNLFKKLESELKSYEEIYKEQLLSSEIVKRDIENKTKKKENRRKMRKSSKFHEENKVEEKMPEIILKKRASIRVKKTRRMKTNRSQATNEIKEFEKQKQYYLRQISDLQNFHFAIQTHTSCKSTQQIFNLFSYLEEENELFYSEIISLDEELAKVKQEAKQLSANIKQETLLQSNQSQPLEFAISSKRSENNWILPPEKSLSLEQMQQIVSQLGEVCELDFPPDQSNHTDKLMMIDQIISQIETEKRQDESEEDELKTRMVRSSGIDQVLQDMREFEECEKIMSRKDFKKEYQKQICKKKRSFRQKK